MMILTTKTMFALENEFSLSFWERIEKPISYHHTMQISSMNKTKDCETNDSMFSALNASSITTLTLQTVIEFCACCWSRKFIPKSLHIHGCNKRVLTEQNNTSVYTHPSSNYIHVRKFMLRVSPCM